RILRKILSVILPRPTLFRLALIGARLAKPFKGVFHGRLRAMLDMAPRKIETRSALDEVQQHPAASGIRKYRVVLMTGCAQKVLSPEINDATIRLLTRHDVEVIIPKSAGCCGALSLHMGDEGPAKILAKKNIQAWHEEASGDGLDAIIINTSGCGTTVMDYGHLFANDPDLSIKAKVVADLAQDITVFMSTIELKAEKFQSDLRVAYHSACSLQHGQRVTDAPKALLAKAGFNVLTIPEAHICCGSAGTYNLLQPELSGKLKSRKAKNIASVYPDLVAAGNIGCIAQIGSEMNVPVIHTVQLLDWATGGDKPKELA
ncbi:MAG: hypothetical protein JKX94_07525, partial [Sneathiella sp.]|nr:hypothetical protein [Sneathiella sp.]